MSPHCFWGQVTAVFLTFRKEHKQIMTLILHPQIPFYLKNLFLAGLLLIPYSCIAAEMKVPQNREYVILLHGMARTKSSMGKLENYLTRQGYQVMNDGYPSTREPVDKIAAGYLAPMIENCRKAGAEKIHIVTHSLGGIIVRQYLQNETLPPGSRIVMISPPNKGSELADALKNLWIYKWLNGPAGQVLGTGPDSLPNMLTPVDADIGVITGNRSLNPFFSWLIPGEDDGKVSVERAKLAEMADFLVVPAGHTFIMRHPAVLKQVVWFLKTGRFQGLGETDAL